MNRQWHYDVPAIRGKSKESKALTMTASRTKRSRVAIDVGGTFIDVCVASEDGGLGIAKVPSTDDPIDGVMRGLDMADVTVENMTLLSHGTTVATNALLTRRLPRSAMVTTRGFRDVIEIRRGTREDLWDCYKDPAPPPIRRRDRLEVRERTDFAGEIVEPLNETDAREVAGVLRAWGAESIAVCFMNSYANPQNERRMREILGEELSQVPVSTSSEVLPEIFEHDRFSTTVVNAVLAPIIGDYVRRLQERLRAARYSGDVLLLHSGGGVMTPAAAEQLPVRLAASGLAGGAIASRHVATLCGFDNAIGLDMGGTSCDISLVYGGEAIRTRRWFVEWGYPICFPSIDVHTIGAGGGSLAWIDDGGSLRNGPDSAGAIPGPVCYGRGNEQPTNTDANLALGRLGDELVGGEVTLNRESAERAIGERIGGPLGLSKDEAAAAVLEVANANMADALRLVSVRRGHDPRDFVLVAFGGAGPLHAAELARELAIPRVIVPPNPGVTSALGCLLVDIEHDHSSMFFGRADDVDTHELAREFSRLESEGRERLRAEGIQDGEMMLERSIDMRYVGQWRSLAIPVPGEVTTLDGVVERFHAAHERQHNYRRDVTPVEIYRLNVRAVGAVAKPDLRPKTGGRLSEPEPVGRRRISFGDPLASVASPIYRREDLQPGDVLACPAVVEQLDSTVLIPPDVQAAVDEWGNIRMELS